MDIPGIPTDNLYKFCAILGLTLLVFNTYYSTEMSYKAKEETIKFRGESDLAKRNNIEIERQIKTLEAEYKKAESQANYCMSRLGLVESQRKKFIQNDKTSIEFENLIVNLHKQASDAQDVVRDIFYKLTGLMENQIKEVYKKDTKYKLKSLAVEKHYKYNLYLLIGNIIGIVLASWGFRKWYLTERGT